jgi:hypothetical protein
MHKPSQRRLAVLLAVICCACLPIAGCSAGSHARQGTTQSCYAFAVRAIEHRMTVARAPRACAGMTPAEVNQAVGRAIRDVVGPLHKAAARRAAYRYGQYLEHLVRSVRPAPPAAQAASSSGPAGGLSVRLAALVIWVITAAAGGYLLFGWLAGMSEPGWRRRIGELPVTLLAHFGLALTGLAIWIGFVASNAAALAWVDFGLILPVAGLGMAVLFGWLGPLEGDTVPDAADPAAEMAAAGASGGQASGTAGQRIAVIPIVLHGIFATATILLVLLAAIAA